MLEPIDATVDVPLIHVPPVDVVLSVSVLPSHRNNGPVIAFGVGLTVMTLSTGEQPEIEYEITEVPDDKPITTPVTGSIVPTAVLELDHEPPGVAFDNDIVRLGQADAGPVIAPGGVTTVTLAKVRQPVGSW